ncbi:uncharacterized protein F4822DRAFT_307178 [Hypoxylon trugodes]|uniref:uncharacterized protein n=1 Tax=Hypoxylon trugodes TaxID=326681 RepID=UPI00219813A2|nr:uncharacterized protein F4822DRAFT_307178 [Hypoxylon trugodes]KAI1386167.1 hypothetical protein F4822DRAFT_307178 [Hypoxylon trugodes]
MCRSRIAWLAFSATRLASSVCGQEFKWIDNQVNATICYWTDLRVAVLKDTVYIDGGHKAWIPGMANGTLGDPIDDDNPLGLMWTLNFGTPFNTSTNASAILQTLSKAPGGGAANDFAPNYYDGALLANNDELFLYGGTLMLASTYAAPDANKVLGYMASQYGTEKDFHSGFLTKQLPDGMTRYITFGGTANAPSENKAWYFGGYRSESWGPIYDGVNSTYDPANVSNTFITLDMGTQQAESWKNVTLPTGTPSRASPSMVWVPVGEQGILVVVGGVTYPDYDNYELTSQNEAQSKKDSPSFMSNIDIYDVASNKWYQQPTSGSPPQYAKGCAIVATAQDRSSYNIYYYGGYDGLDESSNYNDDVWILSLPTFMWMKASSGTPDHGRAGHQCVTPYPDQMITIGGKTGNNADTIECLEGVFQAYNLTSGAWMDSYNPDSWAPYGVPEMIHVMIGGSYSGGATVTTPSPSGWATQALGSVFATHYPTEKIATYYPYSSMGPSNSTRGSDDGSRGKGTPSWLAAVLGVVLGLVFVTAVVVAIILYRRRRLLKKNGSEHSTNDNSNKIASWMRGLQSDGKAPTVTSEDTRVQYDDMESRGVSPGHMEMKMAQPSEMLGTPLVELMDTSPGPPPSELVGSTGDNSNTGFTHIARSPFASNPHMPRSTATPTSQPFISNTASHDHAPSISSSQVGNPPPPSYTQRPDSPPLGQAGAPVNRSASGMGSNPRHSRQISEDTVDSSMIPRAPTPPPQHNVPFAPQQASPPLPVSPPSVTGVDGGYEALDYYSVHGGSNLQPGSNNSPRRSIFQEDKAGLGQHGDGRNS